MPPEDEDPRTGDARLAALRRFLPYLWPSDAPGLRMRLVVAIVLVVLAKALLLALPFAYKALVDGMAGEVDRSTLALIALVAAFVGARLGATLFDNLRNAIFEVVGQDAARRLALQVFRHLHRLSLRFHLERRMGALVRIVERGTKSIDTMLYFLLFNIAPTFLELCAVMIIFGLRFGPELVVATLVMVVAYIAFTQAMTEWRVRLRRQWTADDQNAAQRAVDSLLNYETVKYFNAEEREAERYGEAAQRLMRSTTRLETTLAWLNIGQAVITNLLMAGAMALTVWGWSEGRLTAGDLVLVNTLLLQLFRPLDMLGWVYREIRQGLVDMTAMFDLVDTPPEVRDRPDARPLRVTRGELRFEDVEFHYEPDRLILKGVSFTAAPGTTTAIVGPTGAGKSTIARILFRFYDIAGGRVTIDGQDIDRVTQDSLRRALGIVPQDSVLFNDTLLANIAFGREGASDEDVAAAVRAARLGPLVDRLPLGLETQVGERGLKLSGGEKQRVAIARALVKDPPILILDEATSALDSQTEASIQEALDAASAGRTTLVIAHRLSTIVDADQILVMAEGRIVERGRHDELVALGGLYADLWSRQAESVEPARHTALPAGGKRLA